MEYKPVEVLKKMLNYFLKDNYQLAIELDY